MESHTPKYRRASYPFQPGTESAEWRHLRRTPMATGCGVFGAVMFAASIAMMLAVQHPSFLPHMGAQDVATFSSLAMFLLFAWLYAANIAVWERSHVDYIGAFKFNPKFSVHAFEAKNMAAVLSLVLAAGLGAFMAATTYAGRGGLYFPFSAIVVSVFLFFVLFVVVPVPVLFHRTRLFIARTTMEVLIGPICYGVKFIHNYLADVLTSTCLALAQFEFDVCFIVSGAWLHTRDPGEEVPPCGPGTANALIARPIMYALPFWLRFWQCVYRSWESRHEKGWAFWGNVVNAGKYLSCLNVVATSLLHGQMDGEAGKFDWSIYRYMWLAAIVIKTSYCYVWDVTQDWDLGKLGRQSHKKYPLLRKTLMYRWTWYYYFAMVTNFFARAAWALAISPRQCPANWNLVLGMVEILRRGQWSLIRVENEFLQTLTKSPTGLTPDDRKQRLKNAPRSPVASDLENGWDSVKVRRGGSCNSPVSFPGPGASARSSAASGRRSTRSPARSKHRRSAGSDVTERSPLLGEARAAAAAPRSKRQGTRKASSKASSKAASRPKGSGGGSGGGSGAQAHGRRGDEPPPLEPLPQGAQAAASAAAAPQGKGIRRVRSWSALA